MKILVIGSEGFIGNHMVHFLLKEGNTVAGCDLYETSLKGGYTYFKVSRLSPEWDEIFSANVFDFCINASGSGNVPFSITHPFTDFEANTLDVMRILDTLRRLNQKCRYLHISSAAVYGNPQRLPIREDDPLHPLSPYGWHKLMSEQVCREYYEIYGVSVAIVRPFSVYGNGLRKQLLWDVCKKLQQSDEIFLFGTGKEARDFIHIDDLCILLAAILKGSDFCADIYNVANGSQVFIEQIAILLQQAYGKQKMIRFNGEQRSGDPLNWEADISKARSLGYAPAVSLEEGVSRYVAYYKGLALEG